MEKTKYFGSTQAELDHYYGNEIGGVLMEMQINEETHEKPKDDSFYRKKKAKFLRGLRNAIQKNFPVEGEITCDKLKRMVAFARKKDFSKPQDIKEICDLYEEIRYGEKRNEYASIFERLKSKE